MSFLSILRFSHSPHPQFSGPWVFFTNLTYSRFFCVIIQIFFLEIKISFFRVMLKMFFKIQPFLWNWKIDWPKNDNPSVNLKRNKYWWVKKIQATLNNFETVCPPWVIQFIKNPVKENLSSIPGKKILYFSTIHYI